MNVTLKHVAAEAGLSWQTVSKVLNDQGHLFRPATRQKVLDAAELLGYRPSGAARMMRSNKTRQVGLLLRNSVGHRYHNPAAFILMLGINARLEEAGYLLSVVRLAEIAGNDNVKSRVFVERLLDGMLVFGGFSTAMCKWIDAEIPSCVWVDTNRFGEHACIRRDELGVGRTVAERIRSLGCERVVWVGRHRPKDRDRMHYSEVDRREGLRQGLEGSSIELEELTFEVLAGNRILLPDLRRALDPRTVLVAYDVPAAESIQAAAGSLGLTPGHDFGLVCCDETPQVCESWPGLCRVSNDRFEAGFEAAGMLLEQLKNPKAPPLSRRLSGEWVIGNTSWGG